MQEDVVIGAVPEVVVPQVDVPEAEAPEAAGPVISTYSARAMKERTGRFMKKRLHGRFFKGLGEDDEEGKPIAGPRSFEWVKAADRTDSWIVMKMFAAGRCLLCVTRN